jgi:cation diffusion facilitator family transporter
MQFSKEKKFVALSSVLAAVFLTGFKLTIGLLTNSLGILSEAAHSGLDLLAAVITFFAVVFADRPADDDHRYGHGKIENISAFVETLLLILTCVWIMYEAIQRLLTHSHHVETTIWSFLVMGTSVIIDVTRSRVLYRTAKKHKSQALEADALHFSSDVWSSLTVIAGLIFVKIGYPEFDAFAALVVALLVLFVSYRLGRRTIDALMDRVPKETTEKIEKAVHSVDGIEQVRSVRTRSSGSKLFVDMIVAIRRTLPFAQAHAVMDKLEQAVHLIDSDADVVVHAEPFASPHESMVDKIRMIVMDNELRAPHNLEVHMTGGKYFIDFDVEYKKGSSFTDAHEAASKIERQIMKELPRVGKVIVHMEEYEASEHELENVTDTEIQLARNIEEEVEKHRDISACKDLTLLREGDHYHTTFTCQIDRSKTLDEVHQIISDTEADLYREFKSLRRIVIHAEPA